MGRAPGAEPRVSAIGLICKRTHEHVGGFVREVEQAVLARGLRVLLDRECARHLGRAGEGLARRAMVGRVDLAVCLGGDGTFLMVARKFAPSGTPILGVNLGRLGFLTEVEPGGFEAFLDRYLGGGCAIHERMMLEAEIAGDSPRPPVSVLNDVVVNKAALSRMLEFDLLVDDVFVTRYRADGLIISTPTGSTAYSLAAGGPIVVPDMRAIVVNPICPHALSQRPLVVPDSSTVRVRIGQATDDVYLSLDGQVGFPVTGGAELVTRRSPHVTRIVRDPRTNFYELLRAKLGWGERSRGGRFA